MKSEKFVLQLKMIVLLVAFLVFVLFFIIFPVVGNVVRQDAAELAIFYTPFTIWSILASIPLFIAVGKLYQVVLRIGKDDFFVAENHADISSVAQLIKWDVLICSVVFMFFVFIIDITPIITLACFGLALAGILISKFFELLSLWIEKGTLIKIENELTI